MYKRDGASYIFSGGKMTNKRNIVLFGLVIMGVGLFSGEAHATEPTLTVSLSSANVSTNVSPTTDATGTFVQSSPITVGVSTDNATGYTLGIKANDNTYPDRLINATDNSYLSSINTATNLATFKATDLSSITTSGGNQGIWGYLPSKLNSVANTDFLPSPGTAGNIIEQTSDANSTAINYTIALGAKVSPLATLGAYTNAFTITAVANPIPYTIIYAENTVTGMPDNVLDGSSGSTSVTISSTTPTRDGYRFLGWCDQATTNTNGTDTCASGHEYQPGGTVTLDATANANNIKLYAMWGPQVTIADATNMQDVNACPASLTTGQIYTIKDSRDNQDYKVAKLADGKCWMVENLNLAGGTALDADKTDVDAGYISGFSTSNNLTKDTTNNTIVLSASSTSGFDTNNYSYVYNSGNKTNCGASGQNTPCYSYYSWDAATLGSGRTLNTENTDAPYSICPKGWRLPTSGNQSNNEWKRGDFYVLATAYGANLETNHDENSATFYSNAGPGTTPNFLLAGNYYDGSFSGGGLAGLYWSSTSDSNTVNARYLQFGDSWVNSANGVDRYLGFSVRCLFSGQ